MRDIFSALQEIASAERAKVSQGFFKTGVGEYGHGDIFLGATVPECRIIAKKFSNIGLDELGNHLHSKYHEERLIALLVLVEKFINTNEEGKKQVYGFYMENRKAANNWDLVDLSADKIVGEYLFNRNKTILYDLAKSNNLWDRRIAIVATYAFIKRCEFDETLRISETLMKDKHDLIQKAVGWMLREVGKREVEVLERFLKRNYKEMPRTMIRYAIERFPRIKRKAYLRGEI